MGKFKERYDELFGESPPYDPIELSDRTADRATAMEEAAPTASPKRAVPLYEPDYDIKGGAPSDAGFLGTIGRELGAGVLDVADMGLGAAGYAADFFVPEQVDDLVMDTIYSGRQGIREATDYIRSGISEEAKQKAAGEFLTLDPNRTIWSGNPLDVAEAILYKTARALPATAVTLIPAVAYARAGATAKAITSMGASEGTMSMGGIANGIQDEIMAMSTEQLLQESPRFSELLEANGNNVDAARNDLIREAQGFAPVVGGATVAAISSVAGRYFTPIFEKGGGAALGSRTARGFAAEAPQEAAQGGSEQFVQNYSAKIYDLDRQLSEGVAEAAVQEGAIGGVMGGGAGAAFGQRQPRPTPPPPAQDPTAGPGQLGLPGIEPGGPEVLPDEMDQPMPEPQGDLEAQIADLTDPDTAREGVYIAPGTDERMVATIAETLPEELVFLRNVDGQGGHLITKNAKLALDAQNAIANGTSRQAVIGRIVGAGVGKPTDPNSRVVQLLDDQGFVARESMVAGQREAEALGVEWSKEKGNKNRKIIVLTPEEAIERRQTLGDAPADYGVQKDLFDDQPDRPPAVVPPESGQQLDLPLTRGRERGVGRVPMPTADQIDRPANLPEQEYEDPDREFVDEETGRVPTASPEDVSRRQYGMNFDDPGVETVTAKTKTKKKTGRYLVRMYDDQGNVIEEAVRNSVVGAETTADSWAQEMPDANIQVVPETESDTKVQTRARRTKTKPIEPEYETPLEDEIRQDIRKDVPFEERAEPIAAVEGARSLGQAADRLIGEAAAARDADEKARIGGFYNPDSLSFYSPEPEPKAPPKDASKAQRAAYEKARKKVAERNKIAKQKADDYEPQYREAWNDALDAELAIEMSNQKRAVEQAKKRRQAALVEMGKVRQLAKPKRKAGKAEAFTKAAGAVNPAEVRELKRTRAMENEPEPGPRQPGTATQQRETERDYLGEFEGGTREQLDSLANYTVRHKTPAAKEWNVEEFESGPAAYARRDEIKKKYPKRSVTVDVKGTRALDEEFERAVTYREGREADTRTEEGTAAVEETQDDTPAELTGELKFQERQQEVKESTGRDVEYTAQINRADYDTPGKKLKFIRREAEHKRRQDTGQKSIKATTIRRSGATTKIKRKDGESEQDYNKRVERADKGKKLDTQPLTVDNIKLDESVSDRVKRQARAKEVVKEVGKAATKAKAHLRKLKGKTITEGMDKKTRANFLYARNYLDQLIQFARTIQAAKNESDANIKLAEGVTKMLDAAPGLSTEAFANKWGAIARKNEFDDLSSLKFTSLAQMRVPEARTKTLKKTNAQVFARSRLRDLNEQLRTDPLYQNSIKPVLEKMTNYVLDNVSGNATAPYIPTEPEIAEIRFALNMNRDVTKYDPIRQQMKRAGFTVDERGYVTGFEATADYLNINAKAKGRVDKPLPPDKAVIAERLNVGKARIEQRAKEDRTDRRSAARKYDKVNGLIERFKASTASAKTTIGGIKRHEQRLIRGLKKIGAWRDVGNGIGQININGFSSKTYRLVGPRLDSKKMLKNDARATIQKLRPFPIPRTVKPYVNEIRSTPEYEAGVETFLAEDDIDLFNDAAKPITYDAEYTGAADRIGEMMTSGRITGQQVVDTILEIAPQDSFYRNLATRLDKKALDGVEVTYGTEKDFPKGQLGKFNRSRNRIILNRDALNMSDLRADTVYGARVIHTLTHELVHAQTHNAIDNSPRLRQYFEALQRRGREVWNQRVGGTLPYGLKVLDNEQAQAHEFIAEAFSNHEFKQFLQETPVQPETGFNLWRALVEAIRYTFGLPANPPNNLFDAIMLTEDILFEDAGLGGSTQGDLFLTGDAVIDNVSTHVQDMFRKSVPLWDKVKNASRNLMTFEQLHDTYAKYFEGADGDNPFSRYMDAWKRRNAAVSKNMKIPEALSVKWTTLEATDPDGAQELSRIGTEATIDRLTPAKELTTEERAEISETRLKKYDALRARFKAMSPEAQSLYKEVSGWYKSAAQEEAKLLLSASLRGVLTKGPNAKLTTAEYKARFDSATMDEMKDRDSIRAELQDLIPEEELDGLVKELQRMSSLRTIGFGDYFPLMRYGQYTVYQSKQRPDQTYDDSGEAFAERKRLLQDDPTLDIDVFEKGNKTVLRVLEKEFWMFESKTEAQAKAKELGTSVQARLSSEKDGTAITSNAGLNTILTSLKGNSAAQAAIKEHYLRSLSDQAFRKHELKRTNRVGVNYDIQHRNLANYMKQSSYYRAQLEFGWQMGEAIQDMRAFALKSEDTPGITAEQLGRVYQQVEMRDKLTNDNTQLMKAVREGVNVTQFMMLTSPSYWMINSSQPWLVTAPIMGGRYGMGNSYAALKHAFTLIKGPLWDQVKASRAGLKAFTDPVATENAFNVVDQLLEHIKQSGDPRADQYAKLIDDLRDQNIIDINVLTELRQIAEGTQGNAWTNVLDASRILAHITEVSNRTITAIAAYNLVLNDGGTVEEASKYAADMVSQTQFNYSSENKPPLFQPGGPLKWAAPLMFQFMQWPQHMYALLIRNIHGATKGATPEERAKARKSVLGLLGTHAAVGGMIGMALQPIKWAFGMAMFAFGDDDEPYTFANAISGRTFDNLVAETMTELFGNTAGRAVSHGLPTLLGTDLSARMSMGTLYFVDLRGDTAESALGSLAASFGGATLNQGLNWGNALTKIANGDVMRGVEQASPKILRDAIRSVRYYNDGLVNNAGDTVIPAEDMSFAEVFLQGIGFSPDEVSQFYSSQTAIKGAQGYARDRREGLVRKFVDDGMSAEIMREVQEFNRAYPSLRITRSTLIRGAKSQVERESRYRRYGANIDEKQARDFADYGKAYQ